MESVGTIKNVSDVIALDVIKYEIIRASKLFSAIGWLEYSDLECECVISLLIADKKKQFKYGEMCDEDIIKLSRIICRNALSKIGNRLWKKNPEYAHSIQIDDWESEAYDPTRNGVNSLYHLEEQIAYKKYMMSIEYSVFCAKLKAYAIQEGGDFATFVMGLLEPTPDVVVAYKELYGLDIEDVEFSEISFNKLAGILAIPRRKFDNVKKRLQKYLGLLGCDTGLQRATG